MRVTLAVIKSKVGKSSNPGCPKHNSSLMTCCKEIKRSSRNSSIEESRFKLRNLCRAQLFKDLVIRSPPVTTKISLMEESLQACLWLPSRTNHQYSPPLSHSTFCKPLQTSVSIRRLQIRNYRCSLGLKTTTTY